MTASLEDELGLPARRCDLEADLELQWAPGIGAIADRGPFAQAAALASLVGPARAGGRSGRLAIDFLHSRLAPPRKTRFGRRILWATAAAVLLVAVGVWGLLDWRASRMELDSLEGQKAGLKGRTQEAKSLIEDVTFARGWYDRRPGFLDCLLEITKSHPQEGRIWAVTLTIKEDMQVQVSGKAVNEAAVLAVHDRLKANPQLANIKLKFIQPASGTSRDVSFAINLSVNSRGAE